MQMKSVLKASVSALVFFSAFSVQAQQMNVTEVSSGFEVVELTPNVNNHGRISAKLNNSLKRLENDVQGIEKDYNDFKKTLSKDYGIQYSIDVSVMGQKGVPNGGKTATQTIYAPTVSWQMFNDETYGSGTVTASYTAVRYWGNNAADIADRLHFANGINDFPARQNSFDQLTYTQTLFDNKVSLTVGQFPIYDFDGTQYDSDQQTSFVNYALSQNASETYPVAGLGAYMQVNLTRELSVTAGFQNARNIGATTLSGKGWADHRFTSFGQIAYSPTINGQSGQYSVLVYNQPSVVTQPQNTTGWSLSMSQNLSDTWGVFLRANAATGDTMPVVQSYVVGGVMNNPLNRNPLDQIGLAFAFNKVSKEYFASPTPVRQYESVVEGFWTIGVTQFLTITPDVQLYIHPALKTDRKFGTVFSLRGTIQL